MPDLGLFTGLLGGFNKTAAANKAALRDEEDKQSDRENKILSTLLQSDDPEISSAALSAMAEIAGGAPRPKGGFLQRIVGGGHAAVHPALAPVLQLLHTPGQLDVDLGRASRGATPTGSPAVAPGGAGASAVGGPPAIAPPPAPVTRTASVPSTPMTQGGPPSVSALGSPGQGGGPAVSPATPPVMPPDRTVQPPSPTNTPPDANRAAIATSAPAGPVGGPPVPTMGAFTPTFDRTVFLPPEERQRQANRLHAEGIELDLQSRVRGALKAWDVNNQGASDADRQAAHDQILEHELGTAPKWTAVPGTVTGDLLPSGAVDNLSATIPPAQRTKQNYFVRQTASGGRERFFPTAAPAAAINAQAAANRITTDRDAVSAELFGKNAQGNSIRYGELAQPQQKQVNETISQRAANLAKVKAKNVSDIGTSARDARTTGVNVMYPDGTTGHARMTQNGVVVDADGNMMPDDVQVVGSGGVLPPKIDVQAKSVLTGINVMRKTNERLKQAIEDAGLENDNNPLPIKWDQFLYQHGIDPGDLTENLPFSQYAQLGGTSEAYGLRGLIGGRPNQTLIDIYGAHLAQPGNTPQLMYKKLQELDNIMDTVQDSVLKAQNTKLAPNVRPSAGGPATTQIPANYDGWRDQNGVSFHIKTDATGKVTYAKTKAQEDAEKPPASAGRGGRGGGR